MTLERKPEMTPSLPDMVKRLLDDEKLEKPEIEYFDLLREKLRQPTSPEDRDEIRRLIQPLQKQIAEQIPVSAKKLHTLAQIYLFSNKFHNLKVGAELVMKAAEMNYPDALYISGRCFLVGAGVPKNHEKEMEFYLRAGDLHHPQALYNAGLGYINGEGVKKDIKKAMECFLRSAELNYPPAIYNAGITYLKGEGVKKDIKKGMEYFRRNAELNYPPALFYLVKSYSHGWDVTKDDTIASSYFQRYQQVMDMKDPKSLSQLGDCFHFGYGVSKDLKKAFEYYSQAAKLNNSRALSQVGFFYRDGLGGVKKDNKTALLYFLRAVEKNDFDAPQDAPALSAAAEMLSLKLDGIEKDIKKAEILYWRAFEIEKKWEDLKSLAFLSRSEPIDTNKLVYYMRDFFLGASESTEKKSAKEQIEYYEKNEHTKNTEVSYYAATAFKSIGPFKFIIEEKQENVVRDLFFKDIQSTSPLIREHAFATMEAMVDKYGLDDIPARHRISARIAMKYLDEGNSSKAMKYIVNLQPDFLSPEENFDIGLLLFSFKEQDNAKDSKLKTDLLRPLIRAKFGRLSGKTAKEENKFASDFIYSFLQKAAEQGSVEARRFLASIVSSRQIDAGKALPRSHREYANIAGLFKAKTFNDFSKAMQAVTFDDKKAEQKTVSLPPKKSLLSQEMFEELLAKLRVILHGIWHEKNKQAMIDARIDLTNIEEFLYPSLDMDPDTHVAIFINELENFMQSPFVRADKNVVFELNGMKLAVSNTKEEATLALKKSKLPPSSEVFASETGMFSLAASLESKADKIDSSSLKAELAECLKTKNTLVAQVRTLRASEAAVPDELKAEIDAVDKRVEEINKILMGQVSVSKLGSGHS